VEIQRLLTYIRDEGQYLHKKEVKCQETQPNLSRQIKLYRLERGRFNAQHLRRLRDLAKLPGFTGKIVPGKHASDDGVGTREDDMDGEEIMEPIQPNSEDAEHEEEEITLAREFHNVMHVSLDN
jgi:hypothetical protein